MIPENTQVRAADPRHVGEILDDTDPRYTVKKAIEALKASVPIEQVAASYGEFKLLGNGRLLGHCIAPDHEDRTPSMTIYTNEGRFKCFGCGMYGDAIDLERVAGRHLEMWTAVVALSERFSVELPRRPQRWHEWSMEKDRRHDAIRKVRTQLYQRRLLRMFREDLALIEDPVEREEEARRIYEDLHGLARGCAVAREGAARG